jgi:hypothetical protein
MDVSFQVGMGAISSSQLALVNHLKYNIAKFIKTSMLTLTSIIRF